MLRNLQQHVQAVASLKAARIIRLTGLLAGTRSPLTAVYAGNGTNLDYLRGLLFASVTQTTQLATVTPPAMARRLAEMDLAADILLCERPALWACTGKPIGELRFPAWVRQVLDLPASAASAWLIDRHLERETQRYIRRHDYRFDITDRGEDLQRFHSEYYAPYLRSRFGAEAVVLDQKAFMRAASGLRLSRLFTGAHWTAGMLLARKGTTLQFGWFGSACAPPAPGASEVLDVLSIRWAAQQGVRRIVLGNSRPSLMNGVVRYKRKFGARFAMPRFPQAILELRVLRSSEPLLQWIIAQQFVRPVGASFGIYGRADHSGRPEICLHAMPAISA